MTRLARQVRVSMSGAIGWDMGTALHLAEVLGVSPWLVAEWLPEIEAAAMAALSERKEQAHDRA